MFISEAYKDNEIFTIKKNNSCISISTPHLKFLDISNFLAPGCSYSQFLKAYGSELNKGVFPYEWFDSHEKLSFPSLPSPQDFYSKVSNSNPIKSDEDYSKLLQIWEEEGMQNFKDYLIYYNNLDTGPFCIALKNFIDIYSSQEVDIFKDFVTLPGVARKMLFNSSKSTFSLINPADADLYYTLRKNIVGGPSIIFSRYHEKNMTNIKGIDGNKCKAIVGYDCNGLYSYAIKQEMPTGVYVRRRSSTNFKPEVSEKYLDSYVWMDFLMKKEKIKILHKLNNQKEIRIGNYLLDGYCIQNKTVYEYHGCLVIIMCLYKNVFLNVISKINVIIYMIFICHHILKETDQFCPLKKIIKDIKNGILFGAVEVDINVKSEYIQKFKEFPAFFCTCNVPMEAIGEHMLEYCRENDISFDYKRLLISTNQAERILIATPLLRWYLKNNSEVTKIYQIIEYQPKKCFKNFIDKVTEFRIEGDKNPDKAIIGDTYKLLSNSSYRSVLMDKTKHTNVKYLTSKSKMTKIINSCTFKGMEELNYNIFEVETYKNCLKLDTPVQIGFFILQYAKLRMLEFYHDCILKYFKPNSFELTETDTDSIYMAINKDTIDECIKETYKKKFEK